MATNIDKTVYEAPLGMEDDTPAIEIDIVTDSEPTEDGGLDVIIGTMLDVEGSEVPFDANLAEYMDESDLDSLGSDLLDEVTNDVNSRKEWVDTYVKGIELLGMQIEESTDPWEGACNVTHPLLSEALVKFQAETMMETFPAAGPVKTQIIGKQTREKDDAAERVKEDMNYQLTEMMPEYRPEHERMLWGLGLAGNAFKKVYFDPSLDRQTAVFVPAEDIIVPYGASNLQTAPRITHLMRKTKNELRKLQVSGFYLDIELPEPTADVEAVEKEIAEKTGFSVTNDDRYRLLEIHTYLDLPGFEDKDPDGEHTGIALPYVVTLDKGTGTVIGIRRNYEEGSKTKEPKQHFVHYGYVPGFGFYCFGLIHLIGAFAKSGTMLLRQLVDAGTLSNIPGGFKSRGLRVVGDDTPISPGEFRDVDVPSGTIRDNILPLPYKEPSQVLHQLMKDIIDEGRRFASAADLQVSDMSANSPVGTTLAILERTLKVMSAVQARIHYSMRQEFKLLAGIIREHTPDEYSYDPSKGDRLAKRTDYDMVDVIPVSDPNAATMSQKVVQFQAVIQMAEKNPQIYDQPELHRQMLEVLGIKNIGKLIPATEEQEPKDPVTENMALLTGKPVKAFIYQDHEAHIQVHMAAMQDPKIAQLVGQNPQAQTIQAAAIAHIQEHIAFEYRRQIELQLGVPLPKPGEKLPEDVEVQISRLSAKAAEQLLQKNQAEAQQQKNEQQQQDPLVQMQQEELKIKQAELEEKRAKREADQALEEKRIESTERIAGAKIGLEAALTKEKLNVEQTIAGVKAGIAAVKDQEQLILQRNAQMKQEANNADNNQT